MSKTTPVLNNSGQMAIFIAIIFQILFVFFAMSINIGMIVHDKINLQNAVDLGAYYAATKQAEILNAIAHQNYQIRQAWKLLAWRYRVIGTLGEANNPVNRLPYDLSSPLPLSLDEQPFHPPNRPPSICIIYYKNALSDRNTRETLCKYGERNAITAIPVTSVGGLAGFNPINLITQNVTQSLFQVFRQRCSVQGAYSWYFAANILTAYRLEQSYRVKLIYNLTKHHLLKPGKEFRDLDGGLILEGVRKTILKNLTKRNRESLERVELFNSLSQVNNPKDLFPRIIIQPYLKFTDLRGGNNCVSYPKSVNLLRAGPLARADAQARLEQLDPGKGLRKLIDYDRWFSITQDDQSFLLLYSLGVEKNPWYMAYVGVKARTRPKELFSPFNQGVELVARAYAKPFGGRIGPWYSDLWPQGAPYSSRSGRRTDPLAPTRKTPSGRVNPNDWSRLPNYSRFPGDTLGLNSQLAIMSIRSLRNFQFNSLSMFAQGFENQPAYLASENYDNDYLAQDNGTYRKMELAAIAPDLFDITYYSVDINFRDHYLNRIRNGARRFWGADSRFPIRGDIGSRNASHNAQLINIKDQYDSSRTLHNPNAFYFIKDLRHLFTSWSPNKAYGDYTFPDSLFGKCQVMEENAGCDPQNGKAFLCVPGCPINGGRTGYSVKLVSRDYLLSKIPNLGGSGQTGKILNPPQ